MTSASAGADFYDIMSHATEIQVANGKMDEITAFGEKITSLVAEHNEMTKSLALLLDLPEIKGKSLEEGGNVLINMIMKSFDRSLLSLAYRPNEKHLTFPEFRDLNCNVTKLRGSSGKEVHEFLNDLNEAIINLRTKEDKEDLGAKPVFQMQVDWYHCSYCGLQHKKGQ